VTREPSLRASDGDRERAVAQLQEACTQGRLTLEELTTRLEQALAATTYGELDEVTVDLPSRPVFTGAPRRWIVEIFGGGMYRGRWRVGREVRMVSIFAGTALDLREAVISEPGLTVRVFALFAGPKVVVPDHADVQLAGAAVFGSHRLRVSTVPIDGSPQIKVVAYTLFGDVLVRDKPRRSLGALRRR
jgi:hypothetical protein